ncbi:hypothetical protein RJC98_14360 [Pseudomonas allii]|uniref:Uncharacterized protein n=2 Tax=Pseudomonas allii TaxID=2740531 RepID=A0ACC6LD69_9PSED|nr:hypothetical protein [Pseudomonas allii]MDR9876375.1 hypothetical protein [Pseudomonas allii]NWN49094.1 hypothetical protein [Pseudomonas allii]NWN60529.1 hypothetical protein [Pseudomonas allii]
MTLENTGILHEGQMTDHANNVHTDGSINRKQLKFMINLFFENLARALQSLRQPSNPYKELKND